MSRELFDMRKGEEATTLMFGGDDSTNCECIVQGYMEVFVFIDPNRKPVPPMQITANVRDQYDLHRFLQLALYVPTTQCSLSL